MAQESFFSKEAVKELVNSLNEILASTYMLYLKTQKFHWNIEGSNFYSLHKMFEKQYEELAEAIDEIAERIRIFEMKAAGTMKEFLELSALKETAQNSNAQAMIEHLHADHQTLSNILHQKIRQAQKYGDEGTADLYIQRLRAHDKTAWMLLSHLQS